MLVVQKYKIFLKEKAITTKQQLAAAGGCCGAREKVEKKVVMTKVF